MRHPLATLLLALAALAALLPTGCDKAGFADENEVRLDFSTDVVAFDTLFTTVGSPTRQVKVYNRSGHDVVLSSVTLACGRSSRFRLNVDGDTALVARQVELLAGDSLFIFVQANIDPNDQTAPFLVEDAILFGNGQRLPLTAWGRNAVYHRPAEGSWVHVIDCDAWDHTRPHVFLGNVAVDSTFTLRLQAGEEVYFADGAMLWVWREGRLLVEGTADRPVLFSSVRRDGWYSFLPGQWQCIFFYEGSVGNRIDHAVVENGTGGLRAYPGAELAVSNTLIRNMSDCALIGQGSTLSGSNLLVYDCQAALTVLRGGSYDFRRCTFANYWSYTSRQTESVVLANYVQTASGLDAADLVRADFTDCIIYGSHPDSEVLLATDDVHALNYRFDHCWVKGLDGAGDPLFVDPSQDDYRLQPSSPAAGMGYPFEE